MGFLPAIHQFLAWTHGCMAEIYLHIGARMADYIATHPYVCDPVMSIYLPALIDFLHFRIRECLQKRSLALPIVLVMYM